MTEFEQATDDVPNTPVSPGTMLLQARERAGITQEQVARELHITVTKVKSIESDDYLRLNTDTFIRGYLRAYANFLKIDSAPIIVAYQQHAAAQGLVTEPQYATPVQPVAESVEERTSAVDAAPGSVEGADAAETTTTDEPAVEEAPEEAASVVAPTERTLDRLELSFAEECWLEVSDAQGDVLATELQRPGSSVSLLGVAPFSVKLGNAPAVRVTLNGDEVAINPSAGTKVMTISVGE